MKKIEKYKKFILAGIIIIALGVTFKTSLGDETDSLGVVFIALGGLLFIIGMSKKRSENS